MFIMKQHTVFDLTLILFHLGYLDISTEVV
jgi:hypothetical protein